MHQAQEIAYRSVGELMDMSYQLENGKLLDFPFVWLSFKITGCNMKESASVRCV